MIKTSGSWVQALKFLGRSNFNQEVLAVVARRHIATPQPEYVLPNLQLKRSRFVNRTPKNSTGRRRVKSLRTFRELIRRRAVYKTYFL